MKCSSQKCSLSYRNKLIIPEVKRVIVESGYIVGDQKDGRYFFSDGHSVRYFSTYEDQLEFASSKGVTVTESKYISLLK